MDDDQTNAQPPAGAILTDQQVARLRMAVVVMTAVLVIGVMTLIGRIIYLASTRGEVVAATASAAAVSLTPEAMVTLPTGHDLKSATLSGNRLLIHHVGPSGDGLMILDLATGSVQSRITVRRSP